MKSFLKKLLIHLSIILIVLNIISFGSLWILRNANFYKPGFLINSFKKGAKFDYIVLGSSRGLTTIDTKLIDDSLDTKGVNLSMDDTGIGSHYLMLKHFVESGFETDCVILNVEPWNSSKSLSMLSTNDYRFAPFYQRSYVEEYFQKLEIGSYTLKSAKIFPLFTIAKYNLELFYPSLICLLKPNLRNRFDDRGNYFYPNRKTNDSNDSQVQTEELLLVNEDISNIVDLCKQNSIELFFYVAPLKEVNVLVNNDIKNVINHTSLISSSEEMFYDDLHVNEKGRQFVTQYFIQNHSNLLKAK